ncbi:hypothetical protein AB0E67_24560 [Streptomyces sp. NPDC032161]|uniref:hypothetical protein n=1 Tax=unclassified Streptomyces TaxID=2593676 RepID=UPI0033DDCA60
MLVDVGAAGPDCSGPRPAVGTEEAVGGPVDMRRPAKGQKWFLPTRPDPDPDLAGQCVPAADRTLADAFVTITPALVRLGATCSEPWARRRAPYSWAFDKNAWNREPAEERRHVLDWMKRNSLPGSAPTEADVLRRALDAMCRKLDGKAAAAKTARRKRAAFNDSLNTTVEKGYFTEVGIGGWYANRAQP